MRESTKRVCQPLMGIRAITTNFVNAHSHNANRKIGGWSRPPMGFVKLNVDASFSEEDHTGAGGAILRDTTCTFIGVLTAKFDHVPDMVSAEVAALAEGLRLASNMGCTSIRIQSDCLVLIQALQKNEGHSMVAAPLLDTCRLSLLDFGKVVLEHCNRDSNKVAHVLAQNGRVDPPNLWLDSPPTFISELLADDVSVI